MRTTALIIIVSASLWFDPPTFAVEGIPAPGSPGDPIGAAAARRWLEHAYVLTSFYVPSDRLDEQDPEFSLAALLDADPYLEPLRDEDGYRELLNRMNDAG